MAENEPTAAGDGTAAVPWYLQTGGTTVPAGSVAPSATTPAAPPAGPSAPPATTAAPEAPAAEPAGPTTGRHASTDSDPAAHAAAPSAVAAPPRHASATPAPTPSSSSGGFPVMPEWSTLPTAAAKPSSSGGLRLPFGPVGWGVAGAVVVVGAVVAAILLGGSPEVTPTADRSEAQRSQAEAGTDSAPALPSVAVGTSAAPSTSAAPQATGDLNLGVPISSPTCDSTWVVFLGAAIDPATYQADVSRLLASRSDARYLLTKGGCSSMRQQTPEGSQIYAVYVGPYPDQAAACAARSAIGGNAYVKRMDNTTPPEQLWTC